MILAFVFCFLCGGKSEIKNFSSRTFLASRINQTILKGRVAPGPFCTLRRRAGQSLHLTPNGRIQNV